MTVRELNIGDVFRIVGEETLWRKASPTRAHIVGKWWHAHAIHTFDGKTIEVVELAPTSEIRRMENRLVLRNGEVILQHSGAWTVYRCTPGAAFTELVLKGSSFSGSEPEEGKLTEDEAIAFSIKLGSKHLNRPGGTDIFAYKGRVYGRATNKEVLGKSKYGGYKLVKPIDGSRRMIIAGVLTIPGEFALYDIIMEHFGPDTLPRAGQDAEDAGAAPAE